MIVNRRRFLQGCCAAAMGGSSLGRLAFSQNGNQGVVIQIFLRGGMDGLSFLVPHADPDYHGARGDLAMDGSQVLDVDGYFGLHPAAAPFLELYQEGHLALIPACGMPKANRSHFQAQDWIERGGNGETGGPRGGWLTRYLTENGASGVMSGVSFGGSIATALEAYPPALALSNLGGFSLRGRWDLVDDARRSLRKMYGGEGGPLGDAGLNALDLGDLFTANPPTDYEAPNGTEYPNTGMGRTLKNVAQLIRLELGLTAATVDFGGWDTHESQAGGDPTTGYFAGLVQELCEALHAFWNDLNDYHGRVTVAMVSEFGRRVRENDNRGTDHGHGGLMMVLDSGLAAKKVWGEWPGLAVEQLYQRVDVQATTDYRAVLGELLLARLGVDNIPAVFPGYAFQEPLGLFGVETPARDWSLHG